MNTQPEKSKTENQGFSKEAKAIIIAIVTSAVAVVGIVVALAQISNANTAELRADMREDFRYVREDIERLEENLRAELREMRNILLQHVQGHSHLPKTTNPAGANAEPSKMTSIHSDSHSPETIPADWNLRSEEATSPAYFFSHWPGERHDDLDALTNADDFFCLFNCYINKHGEPAGL